MGSRIKYILVGLVAFCASACEFYETATTICSSNISLKGHISYANQPIIPDVDIIVQYSIDNFNTANYGDKVKNPLGLMTVPFDISESARAFCPLRSGQNFQFRAFQDLNGNGLWDSGEIGGRDDGFDNGNQSFMDHIVSPNQLFIKVDTEIFLDVQSP